MSDWWRQRGLPKSEALRLLDGGSGDSAVADLLRAASGPARPGELAGERAAVAAFRQEFAAGDRPAAERTESVRMPRRRRSGHRVAVLAAALTVGALAGTGVAAGSGRLPEPLQRAVHDWVEQVPEPDPRPERTVRAETPTPPGSHRPSGTPTPTHPGGTGSGGVTGTLTAADVKKLCKEWQKVRDDPNRKPMDPADLRALTAAAGGPERIEGFCGLTPTASTPAQHGPPSNAKSKSKSVTRP